jgi:hypothetical protein
VERAEELASEFARSAGSLSRWNPCSGVISVRPDRCPQRTA